MQRTFAVLLAVLVGLAALLAPVALTGATEHTATLTVTVVDQDGNTIDGADVTVSWDDGSNSGTTKGNGRVFLDAPNGENVDIEVTHPDYIRNEPYSDSVTAADEQDVEVPVWQKGRLTVSVQNSANDEPLEGAEITLTKNGLPQSGTTNESGVFVSDPIEQGTYSVRVDHPTYFTDRFDIEVNGSVSELVRLRRGSVEIGFRIVDNHFEDPDPIENVRITVTRNGDRIASVNTDANGEQGVSNVPVNARLQVTASKDGYVDIEDTVSTGERTRQFNLTISRTPAINVGSVADRIVADQATIINATDEYGEPVAGATVLLDGEEVGETDEDGEFRLGIETTGAHDVVVRDGDLSSEPHTITGVSGATPTETATATETATQTATATETATQTATATETATQTATATETSGGGVPGFTVGIAVIALVAAALVAREP